MLTIMKKSGIILWFQTFFVSLYCVNETKAIKQNGKIRKITH